MRVESMRAPFGFIESGSALICYHRIPATDLRRPASGFTLGVSAGTAEAGAPQPASWPRNAASLYTDTRQATPTV
eukprot:scaffold57086_cov59-Phaeocystis_antarctica.AAC.9